MKLVLIGIIILYGYYSNYMMALAALILLLIISASAEYLENTTGNAVALKMLAPQDDYSIYVQPTANDPFMNNENDVLKVLPKFDKKTKSDIFKYEHAGMYQDAGDVYSLYNDRNFITYPADDQQAFIDFLTFGTTLNKGLKYEDLRAKRRD